MKTIKEKLASEGLTIDTDAGMDRAIEILCGPEEAARLKKLDEKQLERELDALTRG